MTNDNSKRTPCEVFTRVMWYIRPVSAYNTGKKSEFYSRLQKCRVTNGVMDISDYNYTIAAVKTTRISHPGHHKRRFEEHKMMLN